MGIARHTATTMVAIIVTLGALLVAAPQTPAAAHHADTHDVAAEQLFVDLINEARADAGVGAVSFRADIWEVAYGWSEEMADTGVFVHNPTYTADICCWTVISENVGWRSDASQSSAQKVRSLHHALMDSPGHRANILDGRVSDVGVGVWYDGGTMYVTQNFRRPTSSAPTDSDYPGGSPTPEPDPEPDIDSSWIEVTRIAGSNRFSTAQELSASTFRAPRTDTLVVARGDDHADALAGASLASAHDAPLLLTRPDGLADEVAAEADRLAVDRVILLGGRAAISDAVADTLVGLLGVDVDRVAGADRFATAALIAETVVGTRTGEHAYIALGSHRVDGREWPDAVAASYLAAAEGVPLLLTRPDDVPDATLDVIRSLEISSVTLVGGTGAVSDAVAERLADEDLEVDRLAGKDRYATSAAIADRAIERGMSPDKLWVTTGRDFPDALAAGPVVARGGDVMLLVDGLGPSEATLDWLALHGHGIDELVVVGAEGAVSRSAKAELIRAIDAAHEGDA